MALSAAQTQDFRNFCNGQGSGYLKEHKAYGMLCTLHEIPAIQKDPVRLRNYLDNALKMEGFHDSAIDNIAAWLRDNN